MKYQFFITRGFRLDYRREIGDYRNELIGSILVVIIYAGDDENC